MKSKLINKNAYESVCRNCRYGRLNPEGDAVLCLKKGIVDPDGKCRRYTYDPLKRVPRKMPPVRTADPEDFSLDIGFDPPVPEEKPEPIAEETVSEEENLPDEEEEEELIGGITEDCEDEESDETEDDVEPDETDGNEADDGSESKKLWSKISIFDIENTED